jgi:predicted transcriptional regulator
LAAIAHQNDMVSQQPSTRAAVKAGEAAREAGRLDGEHGDGSAAVT